MQQFEARGDLLGQALGLADQPVPEASDKVGLEMAPTAGKSRSSLLKKLIQEGKPLTPGGWRARRGPASWSAHRPRTPRRDGEQEQSGWEAL